MIKAIAGGVFGALLGASAGLYFEHESWPVPLLWAALGTLVWYLGVWIGRKILSKGSRRKERHERREALSNQAESAEEERMRRDPATYGMPPGLPPIGDGGVYMYGNGKASVKNNRFPSFGRITAIENKEVDVDSNEWER